MSNFVRCESGLHIYDKDKHSTCPDCSRSVLNATTGEVNKPTVKLGSAPAQDADIAAPTQPNRPAIDAPQPSGSGEKTRVLRTRAGLRPVTGWLVVVEGPGRGANFPLYDGMNVIGRESGDQAAAQSQTVCLDFGDDSDFEIARHTQARLVYDRSGNVFFLQHGDATNLTYVNDVPVLQMTALTAHDAIRIGSTTLRFIPFCSDEFRWDDEFLAGQ